MENELIKIDEFKELISNAPSVLAENQTSVDKAIEAHQKLISIAEQGMNEVIDAQLASYITKAKATKSTMNAKRTPFTQLMTMVAKQFTGLESSIDKTIETSQQLRDVYATEIMLKRQEEERLAKLKLEKEQEAIEIERLYKIEYAKASSDYILDFKTKKLEWFNSLTLETINSAEAEIANFDNDLRDSQFVFQVSIPLEVKHHSLEDKVEITGKLAMSLCYSSMADFKSAIFDFKQMLLDMIQTKRNQLEEAERIRLEGIELKRQEEERQRLADEAAAEAKKRADEADAENKARLEEAARIEKNKAELERQENEAREKERQRLADEAAEAERMRKSEEEAKLREEAMAAQLKAEANATVDATGQSISAMVDTQADLFMEAPKVKESYNIKVLNPAGYLQLISFWFENEGKNLPSDKIESITIARIKSFCEKFAVKNDVTIESKLLVYEPVYKAK